MGKIINSLKKVYNGLKELSEKMEYYRDRSPSNTGIYINGEELNTEYFLNKVIEYSPLGIILDWFGGGLEGGYFGRASKPVIELKRKRERRPYGSPYGGRRERRPYGGPYTPNPHGSIIVPSLPDTRKFEDVWNKILHYLNS